MEYNESLLNAARFAYKYGEPILSDPEYDKLSSYYPHRNWEEVEYHEVERTYKELGIPLPTNYTEQTKKESKQEHVGERTSEEKEEISLRFASKTSMEMLTDENEFINKYLSQFPQGDFNDRLIMIYKIDGWNGSVYYEPGREEPVFAKTRGRGGGQYTDITELLRIVAPKMKVDKLTEVTGEIALKKEALEKLRELYPDKGFINVRNSLSSFIHGTIDITLAKEMITFFAFNKEEEMVAKSGEKSKLEELKELEELGFDTPPYAICDINSYKDTFNMFEQDYKNRFSEMYEADGLVVQNNHRKNIENMKSVTQLGIPNLVALKFGEWAQEILIGEVIEVIFPSGKARNGCVILVKPIKNKLGNTIRRVNGYNLATVLRYRVDKGSKIKIGCHSQQNIVLVGMHLETNME